MPLTSNKALSGYKTRYLIFSSVIILFFGILSIRLWYMQIVKGSHYKHLSENNRIRERTIKATRGLIFDRNGEVLIDNYPYFTLAVIRENVKNTDKLIDTLANVIVVNKQALREIIRKNKNRPSFKPITLIENLNREQLSKIEANKLILPGIEIFVEPVRNYPNKAMASHIVGYLSEINSANLKEEKYKSYKLGDLIGSVGIEKTYEKLLKGEDGLKEVEVDAFGRELSSFTRKEARPGSMLYLTLDVRLQRYVEEIFKGKAGAVVVMDVNNGQVLAQLSKPNFDPSLFVKGISSKNWKSVNEDPLHPLQNRVISGQYSPGSVFKVVVATAALEEGLINKETKYFCGGSYKFGNSRFSCWNKGGHGKLNVLNAIIQSCDVFFYNLGVELGIDLISKYARHFGLGNVTGIELGYEKRGLMPTTEWKKRVMKATWFGGETVSSAIGQSYVLVTPLQIATLFASVANEHYVPVPQLLLKVEATDGTVIRDYTARRKLDINVSKKTMLLIKEALLGVVHSKRGTARGSKPKTVKMAGKTGTVQVYSTKRAKKDNQEGAKEKKELPYELKDHAWFACYAPAESPEIAISVIVEHGGHGSSAAAPIAKKIVNFYFKEIKGEDDNV